jgi:hypothetical protein
MAHWKYLILVSRLNRVFGRGSQRLNAHIMRVAVLYEDMRLENIAAAEESIPALDKIGKEYRLFYFIRRSIATVREFAEALPALDAAEEFVEIRARFSTSDRKSWDKSVRFFRRNYKYIQKIRNDFGGHFGFAPARHAAKELNDTAVTLEFEANRLGRRVNVRHKYAGEIVALGMGHHKRGATSKDHFRLMARLALAGFAHAARCVHFLTLYYIAPQFEG